MKLIELVGTVSADGVAINAWRTAQEFWSKSELVPIEIWKHVQANDKLIQANLAEVRDGGIYVKGSSEYLEWVRERRRAASAGGKKSAQKRTKKQQKPQANAKQNEANAKQTQPSGSGSGSDSGSSKNSEPTVLAISAKPPTPMGVYIEAYREKYGFRPEVGQREGKILKTFSENHPDRWQELIRGYLQMPDSWAVARSHPVEVLVAKVNEVGRFLATGKVVTRKVVEHAEEMIDKAQGTDRKPRKSVEELERERAEMLAEAQAPKAIGGDV